MGRFGKGSEAKFQVIGPRMSKFNQGNVFLERLCVPEDLLYRVIIAQHLSAGHLGVDRLIDECVRRFDEFNIGKIRQLAGYTKRNCTTCIQCDPPSRAKKGKIHRFPIQPHIWTSICMDMFTMPPTIFQGQNFDGFFFFVLTDIQVGS